VYALSSNPSNDNIFTQEMTKFRNNSRNIQTTNNIQLLNYLVYMSVPELSVLHASLYSIFTAALTHKKPYTSTLQMRELRAW
jgi:UDP-N-acetylglucosamine pyrophosphorylase